MPATDLTRRAVSATWWSALEISVRYGAQFVVMVVLARLLSPSDFGLVAMLVVFTSVGALLVNGGFSTALIQRRDTSDDDETTVFVFTLASSALVAGGLFMAAPSIAAFYQQPALVSLTRVMALVLPLGALGAVPDAVLTKRLDFRARTGAEIVASSVAGGLAVVLAWRGAGAWSLAWQAIVALGLRSVLLWVYSGWRPRGRFRTRSFRNLFGFGGYMLMTNLLEVGSIRLQSLLIGRMFDTRALGYYTIAQNTQQAPTSFMSSILNRVGLPVFSSVAHDRNRLLGVLRLSLRVSMFLFVPCMLGIAIVARPLVDLLYGARWAEAAPLLSVLALGASLWPLHVLNLAAISAQGRSDLFFKLGIVKKVVAIALILLASPAGPMAIAWSTVVASMFSVVVNTHYSRKLLGYGVLAQLMDQGGTALASIAAAVTGWAVLHWNPPSLWATALAIALSVVVYVGLAAAGRMAAFAELLQLLQVLREKQRSTISSETGTD